MCASRLIQANSINQIFVRYYLVVFATTYAFSNLKIWVLINEVNKVYYSRIYPLIKKWYLEKIVINISIIFSTDAHVISTINTFGKKLSKNDAIVSEHLYKSLKISF